MLCNIDASPIYLWVYKEHLDRNIISDSSVGLSLCVQGTHFIKSEVYSVLRFIPVCTGNTINNHIEISIISVYPCVYREHFPDEAPEKIDGGLSLCVQGTRQVIIFYLCCHRFIPVCTGNTLIITYCFIIKIFTTKFLPIFLAIFYLNLYL